MIKVLHGELFVQSPERLEVLTTSWSSCVRFAYKRFLEGKTFNEVRQLAKPVYPQLNTRQVSDAILQAKPLYSGHLENPRKNKLVFGGKSLFNQLKSKILSSLPWRLKRDGQVYSRGDRTKAGNPNLRLEYRDGSLFLRVTLGTRDFEYYHLFISSKYMNDLETLLEDQNKVYNVRLKRKTANTYQVAIDYQIHDSPQAFSIQNGVIGVDTNPDRIALAFISRDGNLESTLTIKNSRIFFGSTNKRDYDLSLIVKQIINLALEHKKGIAFENLKFKKDFENQGRRFNRVKSNFTWKKFITLLEQACIKYGIPYKKINPAFTSVIGRFKYQKLFKLSIHESAALVVGRRSLGFSESISLYKYPKSLVKSILLRTLEGTDGKRRFHNWRLWRTLRDSYQAVLTGLRRSMSDLKESDEYLCYGGGIPPG
jgi:IS605 OrfB family transposase